MNGIFISLVLFNFLIAGVPGFFAEAGLDCSIPEAGVNQFACKDSSGQAFTVIYAETPDPKYTKDIIALKNIIFNFKTVKIRELKIAVNEKKGIEAVLLCDSVSWQGNELVSFLPAGLFFIYDQQTVKYDFRLVKDNFFVRINGNLISEDDLLKKVYDAWVNPAEYIKKRDPEYLLGKLQELQEELQRIENGNIKLKQVIIALNNKNVPVAPEIITEIQQLKKNNPAITSGEAVLKLAEKNFKISGKTAALIFAVWFNEF